MHRSDRQPRRIRSLPAIVSFALDYNSMSPVLIDGGSAVCIIPEQLCNDSHTYTSTIIRVVGGFDLKPVGKCYLTLNFGFGNLPRQEFLVLDHDIDYLILGVNFMRPNGINARYDESVLFHTVTKETAPIIHFEENSFQRALFWAKFLDEKTGDHGDERITELAHAFNVTTDESQHASDQCRALLDGFPTLTEVPNYNSPPKHRHVLDIEVKETFRPFTQRARPCSLENQKVIRDNFNDLIERGALVRGSSTVASPITVARKKDGSPRICVDYTRLNTETITLNYPLPRIQALPQRLTPNHKYFSCLDLRDAYFNLPLSQRASELAAIISQNGVFLPLRTPFGLKNAPSRFCELVADMTNGLEDFVFSYLDDFLVFSKSLEDHLGHLKALFQRLESFGMTLKSTKCHFAKHSVLFLGHEISDNGMRPVTDKVAAISKMKPPQTLKEVRGFLGSINYYRKFLPHLAEKVSPLNDLLKGPKRKGTVKIQWGETQQHAFDTAIADLANAATLGYEDPNLPLIISSDASLHFVGAVLEQHLHRDDTSATRPLEYFSKKLPDTVALRSTFNRELTGIYFALRFFKHRVRGRALIIRTDHQALVNAIQNTGGEHSPQEWRMISYIKEYLPTMVHITGEENAMADLLSRPLLEQATEAKELEEPTPPRTVNSIIQTELLDDSDSNDTPLTLDLIAKRQKADPQTITQTKELSAQSNDKFRVEERPLPHAPDMVIHGVVDTASSVFRPIIPRHLRATIFQLLHNPTHPGQMKSAELIGAHYFWDTMNKDIHLWVKTCPTCQAVKVHKHNRQRLQNYPPSQERLHTFHLDLVGPLPESNNHRFIFTLRDRGTGFALAIPLRDKSSMSVIDGLRQRVIGVFGVPATVITDRGGEFTSAAFEDFCERLGIQHKCVTAYHPQANGAIERLHRTLKQALRALNHPDTWYTHLPFVILTMNNLLSDINSFTPHQYTFGQAGRLPSTFIFDDTTTEIAPGVDHMYAFFHNMHYHYRKARPLRDNSPHVDPNLQTCEKVWVRNDHSKPPLARLYSGPYLVLERRNKYFTVQTDYNISNVSIDRLKAAYQLPPDATLPAPSDEDIVSDDATRLLPSTSRSLQQSGNSPDEDSSTDDTIDTSDQYHSTSRRLRQPPRHLIDDYSCDLV